MRYAFGWHALQRSEGRGKVTHPDHALRCAAGRAARNAPGRRGPSSTLRRASSRRGAAALELAVLLPLLGMAFSAAVDFGRVYNVTQTLQDSAFAGVMYASGTSATSASPGPSGAATNAAIATGSSLSPPLQASNVSVVIDSGAGTATVTVTYQFCLVTPVLGAAGTVSLQRTAVMNIAPIPGT